ncbi:MAG TPA: DUF2817 domain-containing protein [Candidatus Saccharimonadales bacterium]|nr:DUF2817 domain-containing protein [Candidatus Saccharimonadales bacterium]
MQATHRHVLVVSSAVLATGLVAYSVYFLTPRTATFSYAGSSCFTNPTLFPETVTKSSDKTYRIQQQPTLAVLGYPVYAQVSCLTVTQTPKEAEPQTVRFGNSIFSKVIRITAGKRPTLLDAPQASKALPTKDPITLALSKDDQTFAYQLSADGRHVVCAKRAKKLRCDIAALKLQQSAAYTFTVERLFKGKIIQTVYRQDLRTVEATHVIGASVGGGATVYNIPKGLTINLDRPIKDVHGVKLQQLNGADRSDIAITTTTNGNVLTVNFTKDLPRSNNFELSIQDITSGEGGYLTAPYVLAFSTSGGPKVTGVNIGSSRLSATPSITITFDIALSQSQAIANFARLEANGAAVAASITNGGRSITLKPLVALPRCAAVKVRVLDGLQNEFGVSGGSAWQFNSRVLCQTAFSIGTSVQGRAIMAYSFGAGPSKIVFVGGTHGNERSSVYILNRWIEYLENNPGRIPANRTIIVIPVMNPDGYAANTRTNAHNVDLNRNFPSNSWKSGVTMPDHSYLEYGGGTAPLSEPESRALANYVLSQNPRLVLTYHASGGVVVPNDSGDSVAIAQAYGAKSSVGYMSNSGTPTFFEYDTTGAFEDWLHDKYSIPALLIELLEKNDNEFSGHQNALWYIAGL